MQLISTRKPLADLTKFGQHLTCLNTRNKKQPQQKFLLKKKLIIRLSTYIDDQRIMLYDWYEVDICVYMVFELPVILMIKESSNLIGVKLTEGLILV